LGCTLYFLLIGQPPYQGPTLMAKLLKHREAPLPSLCADRSEVPPALDQVFGRMMAKKPEERFASMAEVVQELEALALDAGTPSKQPAQPAATPVSALAPTVDVVPGDRETTPAGQAAGAGNQTVDLPPARTPVAGGITVLLVEPSRSQAVIIKNYLQKLGIQNVATASSGQKALESARSAPPQVVLSALHLADMTGVQLAQRLRTEEPLAATGFVLITSQTEVQEANL